MKRHLVGWRAGVACFAVSALLVFAFNLAITIWAIIKYPTGSDGTGLIYEGPCLKVRSINTGVHLFINIVSVILLSGSNYCMQCLSAPTRVDIDSAHAEHFWLDIGIPSIRNLRWISSKRVVMWCFLGISSLPLHLFYNSSVFASISANSYDITSLIEESSTYGPTKGNSGWLSDDDYSLLSTMYQEGQLGGLDRLDPAACIDAYAKVFQSNRQNLFLIVEGNSTFFDTPGIFFHTEPVATGPCGSQQAYEWICGQYPGKYKDCPLPCDVLLPRVRANPSNWAPFGNTVKYCLSERSEEHCKLQFSATILWLVVGLNLSKLVLMCGIFFVVKKEPLMTLGDAISSFIKNPDPTTNDMCLVSKKEITGQPRLWTASPRPFVSTPQRRFAAASKRRWIACISIYITALTLCASLLAYGISRIRGAKDASSLFSLGLGTVHPMTIIESQLPRQGRVGLISNVLLANSPQLILSFIYFTYNALFTCMSMASEWSNFAQQRKGLRISNPPLGSQRTTYFLQLPYRFAIPLVFFSGILHWLMSQSIFLVSVKIYEPRKRSGSEVLSNWTGNGNFITCGWSPVAIVCIIVLGVCMVLWLLGTGSRRLSTGIPVAASSSAAISAACHLSPEESNAWQMGLKWGDTNFPSNRRVGHCSFSSGDVAFPKEGALYV